MSEPLLTPDVRSLIHPHTGELSTTRPAGGNSSDAALLVECEKGPFFVKAVRNRPGGRRDSLERERLINPFVQPLSPALLWQAADDDWAVLGFEWVTARPTDFTPNSPDLPAIAAIIKAIGELPLPAVAEEWFESRWDRFTDRPELFRGDSLLYTDVNPHNFVIGAGTERPWAVDWSWPTRGAGFIDPALTVVQLIAAGHTPESAETWADQCPAWTDADPLAIDAFAAAELRMHREYAGRKPEARWLRDMEAAARAWANHRGLTAA